MNTGTKQVEFAEAYVEFSDEEWKALETAVRATIPRATEVRLVSGVLALDINYVKYGPNNSSDGGTATVRVVLRPPEPR